MQHAQQFRQPDLKQVQYQQKPGIDGGDPRQKNKVVPVKLCGAVKYLAERERTEVGFHAGLLRNW